MKDSSKNYFCIKSVQLFMIFHYTNLFATITAGSWKNPFYFAMDVSILSYCITKQHFTTFLKIVEFILKRNTTKYIFFFLAQLPVFKEYVELFQLLISGLVFATWLSYMKTYVFFQKVKMKQHSKT